MANERVVPKSNEYKEYYIPLKRAERQIHPGVFIFFYFLSLSLTIINQSTFVHWILKSSKLSRI